MTPDEFQLHLDETVASVRALDLEGPRRRLALTMSIEDADRATRLYRDFLCLRLIYPNEVFTPPPDADLIWHAHILDTHAYVEDSQRLFGAYLHHDPYFGLRSEEEAVQLEQAGEHTFERLRQLFPDTYGTVEFEEVFNGELVRCSNCK